jgi:hypothetical protein
MVASQCFCLPTWLVNVSTLKNIDYAGYTERFRNLQARHLPLSFERLGRLMIQRLWVLLIIKHWIYYDMRRGILESYFNFTECDLQKEFTTSFLKRRTKTHKDTDN